MEPTINSLSFSNLLPTIQEIIQQHFCVDDKNMQLFSIYLQKKNKQYYGLIAGLDNHSDSSDTLPKIYDFGDEVVTPFLVTMWIVLRKDEQVKSLSTHTFTNFRPPHARNGITTAIDFLKARMFSEAIGTPFLVPVAKPFTLEQINEQDEYIIQPKFDGVRCLARLIDKHWVFFSKRNKLLNISHQIQASVNNLILDRLFSDKILFSLDGELLLRPVNGKLPAFQEVSGSVAKKERNKPNLIYVIFDVYWYESKLSQRQRMCWLNRHIIINSYIYITPWISTIGYDLKKNIDNWAELFVDTYAGLMVKSKNTPLSGVRCQHMKYKFFIERPATIVGVEAGNIGKAIFIVVQPGNIDPIRVIGSLSNEQADKCLSLHDQLFGIKGVIRYCCETKQKKPRAAVFHPLILCFSLKAINILLAV